MTGEAEGPPLLNTMDIGDIGIRVRGLCITNVARILI
jgi:hypothetical protein